MGRFIHLDRDCTSDNITSNDCVFSGVYGFNISAECVLDIKVKFCDQ